MVVRTENFAPYDLNGANPYDTSQLSGGQHEITALIEFDGGGSELLSSLFTVINVPGITVDSNTVSFTSEEGSLPTEQIINLDTSDSSVADFTISKDADWLTVSPTTGLSPAALTVSVNDSTLVPGLYSATIDVAAPGYTNATITVNYNVTAVGGSAYSLLVSTSADRSNPVPLDGYTATGDIYVFTSPDDLVKRVIFSLDGVVVRTENYAPYDFNGANPYDTSQLSAGQHEISALIEFTDDSTELLSGLFTVTN